MKKNKDTAGNFIGPAETKQNVKTEKKVKAKKGPGFFSRLGGKIKDIFSELKKVSWPTFAKVVKKTGIVLVVVLIFLVVITGFDYGLFNLLNLVSPKA